MPPRGQFNVAINSLPTLQLYRWELSRYLKRFMMYADPYRLLKYRGGFTIPLFQKCVAARHYAVICKQ
jgi:hypothetical protein